MRFRIVFLTLWISIVSCYFGKNYLSEWKQSHPKTIGQTAPPDMIYIEGYGDMKPFYIGVQEETNRNYMIYLKWLKRIFGEGYPEVIEEAYPKVLPTSNHFFNDPYQRDYFKHPAFMHYPVVGISWEQTQNYLTWKTDRLNEYILFKNGVLDISEQMYEDNFNTEAYLFGQYEGMVRKNPILKDAKRPLYFKIYNNENKIDTMPFYWAEIFGAVVGEERIIDPNDGLLFPNFRLPTESEWEHAQQFSAKVRPAYSTWTIGEALNQPFPYKKYWRCIKCNAVIKDNKDKIITL